MWLLTYWFGYVHYCVINNENLGFAISEKVVINFSIKEWFILNNVNVSAATTRFCTLYYLCRGTGLQIPSCPFWQPYASLIHGHRKWYEELTANRKLGSIGFCSTTDIQIFILKCKLRKCVLFLDKNTPNFLDKKYFLISPRKYVLKF